jgi:hypothetical protein
MEEFVALQTKLLTCEENISDFIYFIRRLIGYLGFSLICFSLFHYGISIYFYISFAFATFTCISCIWDKIIQIYVFLYTRKYKKLLELRKRKVFLNEKIEDLSLYRFEFKNDFLLKSTMPINEKIFLTCDENGDIGVKRSTTLLPCSVELQDISNINLKYNQFYDVNSIVIPRFENLKITKTKESSTFLCMHYNSLDVVHKLRLGNKVLPINIVYHLNDYNFLDIGVIYFKNICINSLFCTKMKK